jgi:hypothetical protein
MERDYRQAARLARETLRVHPLDTDSWRLLGASRYLAADLAGALDAWNRAGTPTVDLVSIEGLSHTPHRVVEQVLGIEPGDLLTRTSLTRAARRASLLPAQQMARVTYRAVPGNLAEVRGAIVERTRIPSRADWLVEAVRLPLDRELEFSIGNAATAGDRLTVGWRFWEHRPRGSIAFSFPNVRGAGIWTIAASWQQERYASAPRSEAREARIGWTNWVGARLRLEGGAGVLRQEGRATQAVLDWSLEYRPLDDNVAVGVEARAAPGALSFATGSATARWRGRAGGTALTAGVSVSKTSALAPIDRWPGAGTGRARPLLLRAHPLLDDGIVGGDVFGRAVLQSSVEAERPVLSRGFLRSALAVFADAARAWQRVDGSNSPLHVDVGVGMRLRMAGMPAVRVDVARGLADGRTVLSAGWQIDWRTPPRSTAR